MYRVSNINPPSWAELIVINDASPEPELTDWLRKRAQDNSFKLLENENNLGFVATVNRGMKLHSKRDVLLLNSDVEVANKWLERIYDAAYSRERVGSVTHFQIMRRFVVSQISVKIMNYFPEWMSRLSMMNLKLMAKKIILSRYQQVLVFVCTFVVTA